MVQQLYVGDKRPVDRLDTRAKCVNGATTVAVTPTLILGANGKRTGATFVNDSAGVIYLSKGDTAALNAGIRLNAAGGSYEINLLNPWHGAVHAIAGANLLLVWTEQE